MTLKPPLLAKLLGGFRSCIWSPGAGTGQLSRVCQELSLCCHSYPEAQNQRWKAVEINNQLSAVRARPGHGFTSGKHKHRMGSSRVESPLAFLTSPVPVGLWSQRNSGPAHLDWEVLVIPVFLHCWGLLAKSSDLHLPIAWVYQNKWEKYEMSWGFASAAGFML